MSNRDALLWMTVLAGPFAWFLTLQANFAITATGCSAPSTRAAYLISFMALAFTAVAARMAWLQWKELGLRNPGDWSGVVARSRLLALSGVTLEVGFFIVILAQMVPQVILAACE
jgi:hypothetical protein